MSPSTNGNPGCPMCGYPGETLYDETTLAGRLDACLNTLAEAHEEAAEANRRAERLHDGLLLYGRHLRQCDSKPGPCECGLRELLLREVGP